jgi:hypothetical protein
LAAVAAARAAPGPMLYAQIKNCMVAAEAPANCARSMGRCITVAAVAVAAPARSSQAPARRRTAVAKAAPRPFRRLIRFILVSPARPTPAVAAAVEVQERPVRRWEMLLAATAAAG